MARKPIAVCPNPKCGGEGAITDTTAHEAWYVKRDRTCKRCGHVWFTAEIPLKMVRRVTKLDNFLKTISRDT